MMKVRFRRTAETDLQGIVDWFEGVAPEALPRILDDIYARIDRLIDHPRSGMKVPIAGLRRIVTHKYHFKIAYQIDGDSIVIVGIYRYQNREY
ncbi:MAG: type II toxin-antitoxin system RelE/ParE family toxin [Novosphingobium sp.]|nr:type II toxin-antitoxin system RelE/ParE family toxin [Novosphingobium sp.]